MSLPTNVPACENIGKPELILKKASKDSSELLPSAWLHSQLQILKQCRRAYMKL